MEIASKYGKNFAEIRKTPFNRTESQSDLEKTAVFSRLFCARIILRITPHPSTNMKSLSGLLWTAICSPYCWPPVRKHHVRCSPCSPPNGFSQTNVFETDRRDCCAAAIPRIGPAANTLALLRSNFLQNQNSLKCA